MKKRLIAVVLSVLTVLVVSQIFSIGPTAAQNAQADALALPARTGERPHPAGHGDWRLHAHRLERPGVGQQGRGGLGGGPALSGGRRS